MTNHYETRHADDYIGKLRESDGKCREVVFYRGYMIHDATFPASRLGEANRGEYLTVMTASVADAHKAGRKVLADS